MGKLASTKTKSARARAAILETLQGGGYYTVRDLKTILQRRGIDLEATAQRIYELRRSAHGAHPIRHRIISRGARRVHVYYLDGPCGQAPAPDRSKSAPFHSYKESVKAWVRERLAVGDRAGIERAGVTDVLEGIEKEAKEAKESAGPERHLNHDEVSSLRPPSGDSPPARPHHSTETAQAGFDDWRAGLTLQERMARRGRPRGDLR